MRRRGRGGVVGHDDYRAPSGGRVDRRKDVASAQSLDLVELSTPPLLCCFFLAIDQSQLVPEKKEAFFV